MTDIKNKLTGTGVALVTPFNKDLTVDVLALERLVHHVITGGAEFLVVFGTTGEPVVLSEDEMMQVANCVFSVNNGRLPIVMGCGGNNTAGVVGQLASPIYKNADAILSVSPYYNKPSQQGIFNHYKHIAENSHAPIIIYNVPSRTGSNIEAATVAKIAAEIPNVAGLKEASPSVEQFTYIAKSLPSSFFITSGDDSLVLPHMSLGSIGAISVTANIFPKEYSEMVRLCIAGDYTEARKIHFRLIEFTDSLFDEGSPAGPKVALEILGIAKSFVRQPITTTSSEQRAKIETLLLKFKSGI
jgi:4-hydroxy-tetrahydrodipicolinate synthase